MANHYYLVLFSIGKNYKDEVQCDVVPVDACHFLFGCPWQYDLRVIHDGHKHTYSFIIDGVKIIIIGPLELEIAPKPLKGKKVIYLGRFFFVCLETK